MYGGYFSRQIQGASGDNRISVIFLIIFLALPGTILSQSFTTRDYSVSDGLASSTVNDIAQDRKGVLWFATTQGITSYDGTHWITYSHSNGLPFRNYSKLSIDRKGDIRAFTNDLLDGITFYNSAEKKWSHIGGPLNPAFSTITITSVSLLDNKSDRPYRIGIGTKENGFYIYSKNGWESLPARRGQIPVYDTDTGHDMFYLATEHGLGMVNPFENTSWEPAPLATPTVPIYAIAIESFVDNSRGNTGDKRFSSSSPTVAKSRPNTRIWATGHRWAGYLVQDDFKLLYDGDFPGLEQVREYEQVNILPDGFHGIWAGNPTTFFNIDSGSRLKSFRIQSEPYAKGAFTLFYDRETNLWLSNFRGAYKIRNVCFENYRRKDGLYDDEVTAIAEFGNNIIAFGHNGGFSFLVGNKIHTAEFPETNRKRPANGRVLDICTDREGNLWAAVERKGIVKITPDFKMKWYKNLGSDEKIKDYKSVLTDNQGSIWAAVNSSLFKWYPQTDQFNAVNTSPALGVPVRRFFNGKGNTIYLASHDQGVIRLADHQLDHLPIPKEKGAISVYSIYKEDNENIFVGTAAGLFLMRDNQIKQFKSGEFSIHTPVYFIVKDLSNRFWFGLNNGVIRWDGRKARHFTMKDGLVGRETNRAAGFLDNSGRLWIGTELGASCYIREREQGTRPPPLLELLQLKIANKTFPVQADVTLNYLQNDLEFLFRGISFLDENAISYNLKLEGFDPEWNNNIHPDSNLLRYGNLPPGEYRLLLQAVNAEGSRSPIVSSGLITIEDPYYQTPWFYIFAVGVLSLVILFVNNFITRKRHASHLEAQVRQRTKQLAQSEEELRNIFDNAHDAIFIFDPHSEEIFEVNQGACDMYGFTRDEFIGKSLKAITRNISAGEKMIEETLLHGSFQDFQSIHYRKDGSRLYLELNASLLQYKDKAAILTINRDVTRRRQAEQQIQESLKEKEVLLKEIHHRVKNNLQIISSLLDLQSDKLKNSEALKVFRNSRDRIYSMALVHENLYQSGDLATIDIPQYIRDLVDHSLTVYKTPRVNVTPRIEISPISLPMDSAVPLGLILTELLSNSLQHAFPKASKGKIFISLHRHSPDFLAFTVTDDGTGLPPETQIDDSRSLGFQLVRILTEQLNGKLNIQTSGGTSFKITFPYQTKTEEKNTNTINEETDTNQEGVNP